MTSPSKRVLNDISEGYDDVVRALAKMTKHVGADAEPAVAEAAQAFVRTAADLAEKIKKQSETLAKKAGEEIQEHPIATAALAAAAVGLLGYAITRKPSH
ncbi:MAG: hypothetical protein JNJ73_02110 [Hyphomonadaceae bacterium]|nr:hypothetical protein [Hyphomonadaceae bacterium]